MNTMYYYKLIDFQFKDTVNKAQLNVIVTLTSTSIKTLIRDININ